MLYRWCAGRGKSTLVGVEVGVGTGGVGVTSRKSATADMVMTTNAMMVTIATIADIVPRGTMLYHYPDKQPDRHRRDAYQ